MFWMENAQDIARHLFHERDSPQLLVVDVDALNTPPLMEKAWRAANICTIQAKSPSQVYK